MLASGVGKWTRFVGLVKRGWDETPHLYGSLSIGLAAVVCLTVRVLHYPPGGYITRYKERYLVMRPEDERLVNYPKQYVTDNHLLK